MSSALLALFGAVALGSCLQRISGMGLGLVAGPIVALALGPVDGVIVLNVLACINAAALTFNSWKYVDWHRFRLISSMLLVGAIPAAYLVRVFPPAPLQVLVGSTLSVALLVVIAGRSKVPQVTGNVAPLVAGFFAGFMNTVAAVAGPSLTVYAKAARWEQRSYAATLQPCYVIAGLVAFAVKTLSGAASLDGISGWVWPLGLGGLALGISVGSLISHKVSRARAFQLALCLAVVGSAIVLVRGLVGLM